MHGIARQTKASDRFRPPAAENPQTTMVPAFGMEADRNSVVTCMHKGVLV